MSTITNVGWYLFSTNTDKSWNELKKDWGLENCTLFQYIYELTGVPIANETQLGNNNWSPINVRSNNPNLKRYTAYWVNVINVTNVDNPVSQTIFYYSNTTTTRPDGLTRITSNSYSNDLSLNSVYIGSNVTTIGEGAFLDATSLTSVIFATGSQLESIGQNAFHGASNLTSITIPAGVSSIGLSAFSDMTSLASFTVNQSNNKYRDVSGVLFDSSGATLIQYPLGSTKTRYDIPTSVINIGINAFQFATGLKSITIPSSVESIGEGAFYGATTLASITIPSSVKSIGEGAFSTATNLESVIFVSDSSLNSIGEQLFQGATKLESITIPEGVTIIGQSAFQGVSRLASIIIPSGVTSIGVSAFQGATSLATVTFEADSQLESIGSSAFQGVTSLASITIPVGVTKIEYSVFAYASNLASVIFEADSSLNIIGESAFLSATSLVSITIPASVTSIGANAFRNASSLATVIFEADSQLTTIGETAFYDVTSLVSITIPKSVTTIGPGAFQTATGLASVIFEADSSLNIIGTGAFNTAYSLTSITIPKSVAEIGKSAFQSALSLTSVLIEISRFGTTGFPTDPGQQSYFGSLDTTNFIAYKLFSGNYEAVLTYDTVNAANLVSNNITTVIIEGYSSIGANAFNGASNLTSVTISASVTSIGTGAFYGASALTSITIPATVISIGDNAFYGASKLASITVNQSNTRFKDINGVLFNKDGTTLIQYPIGNTRTSYEIPATVTSIGANAFGNATSLTSITIPASVTSIGTGAFQSALSLTSITIPASVTEIGVGAFYGAKNLTSITVNQHNTHFKDINGVLFNKDGTTLIRDSIGNTRTSYEIPATVTSIGQFAFEGTNLTSITIPAGVTTIDQSAFSYATSLTSVTFAQGSQVTSIGYGAFQGTSLTSIIIPASVTEIGNYVVPNRANFTVYIANDQGQLGISSPATSVNFFGTTVTTKNISYSDNGTTATFLGASGQTLGNGDNDGDGINKLNGASEAIILGYSSIADYEFYQASNLTSVTISASVTSIGGSAFNGASSLTSVIFEEGSQLKSIGTSAFWSATSLTSITIPEGVTEIGSNAFYNAYGLAIVWIHEDTAQRLNTNTGSQLPLNVSTYVSFYGQQIINFNVYQTAVSNRFDSGGEFISYYITESTDNATINTLNFALTGGSVNSGLTIFADNITLSAGTVPGILLIYQLSSSVASGQGIGTTRLFNKNGQSEIESYSGIYIYNSYISSQPGYINYTMRVEANTKYVIVFGCHSNTTGTLKIKMNTFY